MLFADDIVEINDSNQTYLDNNISDSNLTIKVAPKLISQKVLYLSYDKVPTRVIRGELFPITLKIISTVKDFKDISYKFSNTEGLELLNDIPKRVKTDNYIYDTFYYLSTGDFASLPDINATVVLNDDNITYLSTQLPAKRLNVISLNPTKEYANIVAKSFSVTNYKTTTFDQNHNIIIFSATAINSNLKSFNIQGLYKQGIESIDENINISTMTYYAIVSKDLEEFRFSYFQPDDNSFEMVEIPIIIDDDSVATQTDLKPKDQSKDKLKMIGASVVAFIGFLLVLWRRKYIYLFFIVVPLIYVIYLSIPSKIICIKDGSAIHLLPVHNGTIFEKTVGVYHLPKEGEVKGFIKVKLDNNKIGWVENEDICTN